MARPEATDHMQSFRFHASVVRGVDFLSFKTGAEVGPGGEAGFQSITIPELSVDPVEYREGTYTYTRKYPGVPTVADVSFMRGVAVLDTNFHEWVLAASTNGEYRADIAIWHYHRTEPRTDGEKVLPAEARIIVLHEAFATRSKPGTDLDSTSAEVSIQEVDVAVEWFEVITTPTTTTIEI